MPLNKMMRINSFLFICLFLGKEPLICVYLFGKKKKKFSRRLIIGPEGKKWQDVTLFLNIIGAAKKKKNWFAFKNVRKSSCIFITVICFLNIKQYLLVSLWLGSFETFANIWLKGLDFRTWWANICPLKKVASADFRDKHEVAWRK